MSAATYLRLGYGTSRGQNTYGYTIVRLTDEAAGKTFRCMGGGYDMVGTVLADWATATHQDRLQTLADRAYYVPSAKEPGRTTVSNDPDAFYGMYLREDGTVHLDGGCGQSSIERILKAAGIELTRTFTPRGVNRGQTTGWMAEVSD